MVGHEFLAIEPYIKSGVGIDIGCGHTPIEQLNVVGIDNKCPEAQAIVAFEEFSTYDKIDFALMINSLRFADNPSLWIKKVISFLNPGGKLIIIEDFTDGSGNNRWYPNELEGFLMLFDKELFIEHKRDVERGKTYMFVCHRKRGYNAE